MIMSAAGSYLWVGWVALFVFPSAAMGTPRYLLTMSVGVVGAMLGSALAVWIVNRLRRVHRSLTMVAWAAAVLVLLGFTLPVRSRLALKAQADVDAPIGAEGIRPNILLVTLDTLRYDFVGAYRVNRWIQTPTLDALAADGTLFEQAISQSPTTTPSHCSIMTSVYPNVHDALNGKPMKPELLTLADCLRENGYETIAFTSSTTTRSVNTGLDRGFDRYVDSLVPGMEVFSRDEFQNLIVFYLIGIAQRSQIPGSEVTRRALDWLDTRAPGPFFCWLHYFDAHDPYEPPPPYDSMYTGRVDANLPMATTRENYAGEVSYADFELGRVIEDLKKRGLYEETLIVVASDHGEGFGEKHWEYVERLHGGYLYDTTQHVPLIMKTPKAMHATRSKRVPQQVELIDIAPTILAATDLPIPNAFGGRSLLAGLIGNSGDIASRPAHSMTWVEACNPQFPDQPGAFVRKIAHRTPDWKYILVSHFDQEELYNLRRDPRETRNVGIDEPELCAERMDAVKSKFEGSHDVRQDPRARLAPALRKQLEALGYLGAPIEGVDDAD
jgi:arylsulfatase A-like enzyme/uncharacterized membrane protein YeaQ/YmgE (transglycosylase-associated protein family)